MVTKDNLPKFNMNFTTVQSLPQFRCTPSVKLRIWSVIFNLNRNSFIKMILFIFHRLEVSNSAGIFSDTNLSSWVTAVLSKLTDVLPDLHWMKAHCQDRGNRSNEILKEQAGFVVSRSLTYFSIIAIAEMLTEYQFVLRDVVSSIFSHVDR